MDWQGVVFRHRIQIVLALMGAILSGLGIYLLFSSLHNEPAIQVIDEAANFHEGKVIVQVTGAVNSGGVFEMDANARVVDAIDKAGGLSEEANTDWVDQVLNMASKLTDGQKIYIPKIDEQSDALSANNSYGGYDTLGETSDADPLSIGSGSQLTNINTASQSELEKLWGIGPVTAQNIIEQRPYSNINELLEKKILKANVFERNEDLLTVY